MRQLYSYMPTGLKPVCSVQKLYMVLLTSKFLSLQEEILLKKKEYWSCLSYTAVNPDRKRGLKVCSSNHFLHVELTVDFYIPSDWYTPCINILMDSKPPRLRRFYGIRIMHATVCIFACNLMHWIQRVRVQVRFVTSHLNRWVATWPSRDYIAQISCKALNGLHS